MIQQEYPFDQINYWPVSLLSHMSKFFERIIFNQKNKCIEPFLSNPLTGFQKNDNTQDCLLKMLYIYIYNIYNIYVYIYLYIYIYIFILFIYIYKYIYIYSFIYKYIYLYIYIYIYIYKLYIYHVYVDIYALKNTDENIIFFVRSLHHKRFGKAQHWWVLGRTKHVNLDIFAEFIHWAL